MSNRFFAKELPDSPVYVAGHPMMFDVLETSDPLVIQELDKCIARGVGGVSSISAETYESEVKKKEQEKRSGFNSKPLHRRTELSAFIANPGAAAGNSFARRQQPEPAPPPAGHLPDPIEVPGPDAFALPPTAKMKDIKAMADRVKPK